jgi:hypothetical protein
VNDAVQLLLAESANEVLLALPVQAPAQPAKVDPADGVAVNVTAVSLTRFAVQVLPQSMPAGVDVTVPVPDFTTISETVIGAAGLKFALQVAVAPSVICVLAAVPGQLPDQPPKVEPLAGVAVNVTTVFSGNVAEQALPQLIPAGLEVTIPLPVPASVTTRLPVVTGGGVAVTASLVKVAVQAASSDNTPVKFADVPEQWPAQPLKVEPLAAVAVSTMLVLIGKFDTQVVPQDMPVGTVVTVPLPVPDLLIVRL